MQNHCTPPDAVITPSFPDGSSRLLGLANIPANDWNLRTGAAFAALYTKLNGLTRLNRPVPSQIGCGVRIAATDGRVPTAGHTAAIGIAPTYIPTINCAGTVIPYTNRRRKAAVPFIANDVLAIPTCRH